MRISGPPGPRRGPGARRAPWPKGPEGPFGPLGPLALGLLHGALGPPLGPPRFARKNRNCAARKLRCELAALRRNCAACKWVGGRAERRRIQFYPPKKPLRDAFLALNTILSAQKAPAGRFSSSKYNLICPKGPCGMTFCYSQNEIFDIGTDLLFFHCFAKINKLVL